MNGMRNGHDGGAEFIVERVGESLGGERQDVGIEYYRYVDETAALR